MGLFKNKRKQAEQLFETGSKGVGTVLQVQDTGMTINDNPRVKMAFRVEPLDGGAAFDAQKTSTVSRVEIPRQGDRYPIWYDPSDAANTWAYATVADDNGRATMRQLFGEAANKFVGMGAPAAPAAAPAAKKFRRQGSPPPAGRAPRRRGGPDGSARAPRRPARPGRAHRRGVRGPEGQTTRLGPCPRASRRGRSSRAGVAAHRRRSTACGERRVRSPRCRPGRRRAPRRRAAS